jgi:hypothetical protein
MMTALEYLKAHIEETNIPKEHWENEIAQMMGLYADYYHEKHCCTELSTKKYEIDFGTHLRCGIEVTNNELNILGAIDGWGDGVSKDVIVVKYL